MRNLTPEMIAWLAQAKSRAICLSVTRSDGLTFRGTNWDANLVVDGDTYYHTSGGAIANVDAQAALSVGNTEIQINFDLMTQADLKAGRFDGASYTLFLVNPFDLTMGRLHMLDGNLGTVTLSRLAFRVELFDKFWALQQTIGRIAAPTCPYMLGDSECTLNLAPFTVTGTLDSILADQLTVRDSARTEAGPSGGVSITGISNANPCVITTATPLGLPHGSSVYLKGSAGPVGLNGPVQIRNPSGNTFEIDINTTNTTDYPPFAGTWTVTPLGAESGYFDEGEMTITSGPNAGIMRRVKSYLVGQWTLHDPFPTALTGTENYSMVAGDDKTAFTCKNKFNNLINFGGFPFVPGIDQLAQIGRGE